MQHLHAAHTAHPPALSATAHTSNEHGSTRQACTALHTPDAALHTAHASMPCHTFFSQLLTASNGSRVKPEAVSDRSNQNKSKQTKHRKTRKTSNPTQTNARHTNQYNTIHQQTSTSCSSTCQQTHVCKTATRQIAKERAYSPPTPSGWRSPPVHIWFNACVSNYLSLLSLSLPPLSHYLSPFPPTHHHIATVTCPPPPSSQPFFSPLPLFSPSLSLSLCLSLSVLN